MSKYLLEYEITRTRDPADVIGMHGVHFLGGSVVRDINNGGEYDICVFGDEPDLSKAVKGMARNSILPNNTRPKHIQSLDEAEPYADHGIEIRHHQTNQQDIFDEINGLTDTEPGIEFAVATLLRHGVIVIQYDFSPASDWRSSLQPDCMPSPSTYAKPGLIASFRGQ